MEDKEPVVVKTWEVRGQVLFFSCKEAGFVRWLPVIIQVTATSEIDMPPASIRMTVN